MAEQVGVFLQLGVGVDVLGMVEGVGVGCAGLRDGVVDAGARAGWAEPAGGVLAGCGVGVEALPVLEELGAELLHAAGVDTLPAHVVRLPVGLGRRVACSRGEWGFAVLAGALLSARGSWGDRHVVAVVRGRGVVGDGDHDAEVLSTCVLVGDDVAEAGPCAGFDLRGCGVGDPGERVPRVLDERRRGFDGGEHVDQLVEAGGVALVAEAGDVAPVRVVHARALGAVPSTRMSELARTVHGSPPIE